MNSLESKLTPEKLEEIVNSAISAEKHYITYLRNIAADILLKSIANQQRRDLPGDLTTIITTKIIKLFQGNDSQNTTENNSSFQPHIRFLKSRLTTVNRKILSMNATELFDIIQINKRYGPEAAINHISPLIEVPLYRIPAKYHNLKIQVIPLDNQESDQSNQKI